MLDIPAEYGDIHCQFKPFSLLVETGYWVPGSPGPLVWGDLLGKLETEQKKYQEAFPIKLNITARDP